MAKIRKRVVTITMLIDDETHSANCTMEITEDGKVRNDYNAAEVASTLQTISTFHDKLSQEFIRELGSKDGLWE